MPGMKIMSHLMGKQKNFWNLVDGVRFSDGKTLLRLDNGLEIFLHDVEKFEIPRHNKKEI